MIERVVRCSVLACAVLLSGCVMTQPARTGRLAAPSELDLRRVSFVSPSGATIRAWYLEGDSMSGAVLLLHGVGDNRTSMVGRARFLHRLGYSVLLPDFQAHGESGGKHITFGALESLDARAALEYLRGCTRDEPIAVIGVSLGGAAALLGPSPLDVDALVLESVYPTIRQALDNRLTAWLGPISRLNRWITPMVMRSVSDEIGVRETALRPIDRIALIGAPVFVIAGTIDPYTPLAESQALFEQAREPKEFWGVEGAGHENLHAFAGAMYEHRVSVFLAKYLRSPARVWNGDPSTRATHQCVPE